MNDELKKYVNAYMDGEEVEYTSAGMVNPEKVRYFEDFDPDGEDDKTFRIKPKAEDNRQRVIDEGYLCKFWEDEYPEGAAIGYLKSTDEGYNNLRYQLGENDWWTNCEVLREKGIKQPYFQGEDIPEIDGSAVIYYKDGDTDMLYAGELHGIEADWSDVVAYIEV